MVLSDETPEPTPEAALRKAKGLPPLQFVLLIAFGLAFLGITGYFFLNRLTDLEQQVARLNRQVGEAVKKVEEVGKRSEAALLRASQAEENALQAARGRDRAEEAKAEAGKKAEQAREEAEVAKQEAVLAREETERIRKQREEELDRLQKALGQIAETRRTALGLVINLGSDSIKFDFDKATLRPENRELLSRIAGVLLTSKGHRIDVYGHTDEVGSEEYNLELSERRAQAVHDYLVKAGIDPNIITTTGFGKSSPLVPGTDAKARAINRRVEIGIVDSVIDYKGPVPRRTE